MKANSNPEILRLMLSQDLNIVAVSGFEVRLAVDVGFPGSKIFFNGNGKQKWEMSLAAQNNCVMNVDSIFNARQLVNLVESEDISVNVMVRLNIDLDPDVHPYLNTVSKESKFGVIDEDTRVVFEILHEASNRIKIIGLHCHLGSTINDVTIYAQLFHILEDQVIEYKEYLADVSVINVGGGLGIDYKHEKDSSVPSISSLSEALPRNSPFTLMMEPGRSLVGNAGALLTQVVGMKKTDLKNFIVVDGSMTELIRPALYDAFHNILPVTQKSHEEDNKTYDVVGPVCESADFLGKDRQLGEQREGDLLAVLDAGAYCSAMSSNYNLRARPAEVLVNGDKFRIIRERESYESVIRQHETTKFQTWTSTK